MSEFQSNVRKNHRKKKAETRRGDERNELDQHEIFHIVKWNGLQNDDIHEKKKLHDKTRRKEWRNMNMKCLQNRHQNVECECGKKIL